MDINQIKDICTLILFGISVWGWYRSSMKDGEEQVKQFTKVNWKLDTVCQSQTDIKDDIRELKKNSNDTDKRLSIIEEQIKVANHRIDDLERKE